MEHANLEHELPTLAGAVTPPARQRRRPAILHLHQLGDFSLDDLKRVGIPVDSKAAKDLIKYPKLAAVRYIRVGGTTPRKIEVPTPKGIVIPTPKGIVIPSPLPYRTPGITPQCPVEAAAAAAAHTHAHANGGVATATMPGAGLGDAQAFTFAPPAAAQPVQPIQPWLQPHHHQHQRRRQQQAACFGATSLAAATAMMRQQLYSSPLPKVDEVSEGEDDVAAMMMEDVEPTEIKLTFQPAADFGSTSAAAGAFPSPSPFVTPEVEPIAVGSFPAWGGRRPMAGSGDSAAAGAAPGGDSAIAMMI